MRKVPLLHLVVTPKLVQVMLTANRVHSYVQHNSSGDLHWDSLINPPQRKLPSNMSTARPTPVIPARVPSTPSTKLEQSSRGTIPVAAVVSSHKEKVVLWHRKELRTDGPNPRETAERDQDALNSGGDDENQESDGGSDSE